MEEVRKPTRFEKNNLPLDIKISFNKGVDIYQKIQSYEDGIISKDDFIKEVREVEERYRGV